MHHVLETYSEAFKELLFPSRCVACEEPGELLCDQCIQTLKWINQRWACPYCGAPYGWLCCTECEGPDLLDTVVCAQFFSDQAARMVTCFKDQHELRLAPIMAAAMLTSLEEAFLWKEESLFAQEGLTAFDGICFVPATQSAYLRRGYDHMELIAAELSELTGIRTCDVLSRADVKDQRELGRHERFENLKNSIQLTEDIAASNLLLIDDVYTTGSSLHEAARALKQAGAAHIVGLVLARVF